jgi:glucose/arabinose dehydrogenase
MRHPAQSLASTLSVAFALALTTLAGGCAKADSSAPRTAGALETRPPNSDYKPAFQGQTRAPGIRSDVALQVAPVVTGLDHPWGFDFLPDGRMIINELEGRMRIAGRDGALSAPIAGLPKVDARGQGGLLDVAVDPDFARNQTIFFSYSEPRQGGNGTALARARLIDGPQPRLEDLQVIFRQMPTYDSDKHFGSRIVFAPDGTLFLTMGERSDVASRVHAQDLGSDFGKIVRINKDGSIPNDNPFVGKPGARPEIFSYGNRNVQAAALHPVTHQLWEIEHGPRGGDELNLIQAGRNYGWPVISYGIEYSGKKMPGGATAHEGMEQPNYYWDPVIAPSGMIFYTGDLFPAWRGNIFVGGLESQKLVRLVLDGARVTGEEWLLQDQNQRIRDVNQGPDGAIYVAVDGGSILRVAPKR